MIYRCNVKSKKPYSISNEGEYCDTVLVIEAKNRCELNSKLMVELDEENIPDSCLPLEITITQ